MKLAFCSALGLVAALFCLAVYFSPVHKSPLIVQQSQCTEQLAMMPEVGPYQDGRYNGVWDATQQRVTWIADDKPWSDDQFTYFTTVTEADPPAQPMPPGPAPAPKAVVISADDLTALLDAAIQRAFDKRFGPAPVATATGCGAATVSADAACGAATTTSSCGSSGGRQGILARWRNR
jgi:hypothetical protein